MCYTVLQTELIVCPSDIHITYMEEFWDITWGHRLCNSCDNTFIYFFVFHVPALLFLLPFIHIFRSLPVQRRALQTAPCRVFTLHKSLCGERTVCVSSACKTVVLPAPCQQHFALYSFLYLHNSFQKAFVCSEREFATHKCDVVSSLQRLLHEGQLSLSRLPDCPTAKLGAAASTRTAVQFF